MYVYVCMFACEWACVCVCTCPNHPSSCTLFSESLTPSTWLVSLASLLRGAVSPGCTPFCHSWRFLRISALTLGTATALATGTTSPAWLSVPEEHHHIVSKLGMLWSLKHWICIWKWIIVRLGIGSDFILISEDNPVMNHALEYCVFHTAWTSAGPMTHLWPIG